MFNEDYIIEAGPGQRVKCPYCTEYLKINMNKDEPRHDDPVSCTFHGAIGTRLGVSHALENGNLELVSDTSNPAHFEDLARQAEAEKVFADPRVKAFLQIISFAEGGHDYNTLYNGPTFSDYSTHPADRIIGGTHYSAAGKYQITRDFWKQYGIKELGLTDFSPRTQDLMATRALIDKAAIALIERGDIAGAIARAALVWASLPGNPWKHKPRITVEQFVSKYNMAVGN
jgi:muramidase (phage lysozyme)